MDDITLNHDYSNYSLEQLETELSATNSHWQKDKYQTLQKEIDRRHTELHGSENKTSSEPKVLKQIGRIISGVFVAVFLWVSYSFGSDVYTAILPPELPELKEYNAEVSRVSCNFSFVDDVSETKFYNLVIDSLGDEFSALGYSKSECNLMKNKVKSSCVITLWHHQGEIFQLRNSEQMLFDYDFTIYQRSTAIAAEMAFEVLVLLFFWVFLGRFFFKALRIAFGR